MGKNLSQSFNVTQLVNINISMFRSILSLFSIPSVLAFIVLSFSHIEISAQQISSDPQLPVQDGAVTVFFDANQCSCPLEGQSVDLYAHTGVILQGSNSWSNVIGNWGDNNVQPMLENLGGGMYQLQIESSITNFYGLQNQSVSQLAFVFRNATGTEQTADLFLDVFANDGLNILSPSNNSIHGINEPISIRIIALGADSIHYSSDNISATVIGNEVNTEISYNISGDKIIDILAFNGPDVLQSTLNLYIANETRDIVLSDGSKRDGIEYFEDSKTTRFMLEAPNKNFVFLIGDFNDWTASEDDQMNYDPSRQLFWIDKTDLNEREEYAYQYFIDGEIRVADPYTEKVLDPSNDQFISNNVYPDLKPYPVNKTTGIVSTITLNEEPFDWRYDNYTRPKAEELVIYELLMREFLDSHNYLDLIDTLDYLKSLGINAIEFMPVNEFEGNSSWGYNTSFHMALDKYYGTKEDFKMLIDECHRRGIAVILDIVLNHTYSQNPMVQMYWNSELSRPAANNPWFNELSPNQTFSFGYDMNHDRGRTRAYSKDVLAYWIEEYHIDGYRLDFTKGLTQRPGDGGFFDQNRINLLKEYADHVWSIDDQSYVILEHFGPQNEEMQLAAHGMMLWGNHNHNFSQVAMGYPSESNFIGMDFRERGFSEPLLIPYMESHDEERQMFKTQMWGNTNGTYDPKDFDTAIERSKMAALLYFTVPGPKLIWMFGEFGFDISIDDPCRICEKPVFWSEASNPKRQELKMHYQQLLNLRDSLDIFHTNDFDIDAGSIVKHVVLRNGQQRIIAIANTGTESSLAFVNVELEGEWYEYFGQQQFEFPEPLRQIFLQPGEFRLYSNFQISEVVERPVGPISFGPNPGMGEIEIFYSDYPVTAKVYNMIGQMIAEDESQNKLDFSFLASGTYWIVLELFDGSKIEFQYVKI